MGYNTVAFMLNDFADQLEKVDGLGTFLRRCMSSGQGGNLGQRIEVLPSQHADTTQVILAGQNRITMLPVYGVGRNHTPEALLHALAHELGYTMRKKTAGPRQTRHSSDCEGGG